LVTRSSNWDASPVTFPPGREKLCTNPHRAGDDDDIDFQPDEIPSERRQSFRTAFGPAILDRHGLMLDPAQIAKTASER
jgi:hypothetical protein